jgi:hypothetical protein
MGLRSKRKGDDYQESVAPSSVAVVRCGGRWDACKEKLVAMRNNYNHSDNTKERLMQLQHDFPVLQKDMNQQANELVEMLDTQIETLTEAYQVESDTLYQMRVKLTTLQAEREELFQNTDDLDQASFKLRNNIAEYQEQAKKELEMARQLEKEQTIKVSHIKHQISLYANCTGVKWDFDQDDVLEGEVVSCVTLCKDRICASYCMYLILFNRTFLLFKAFERFALTQKSPLSLRLPITCGISWRKIASRFI